jgi:hypothetical protein
MAEVAPALRLLATSCRANGPVLVSAFACHHTKREEIVFSQPMFRSRHRRTSPMTPIENVAQERVHVLTPAVRRVFTPEHQPD